MVRIVDINQNNIDDEVLFCKKTKQKQPGYQNKVKWMKKRFKIELDPETEISSTSGSKEAVFNFHEGFVDPSDIVLVPNPGYPPMNRGTLFAEGEIVYFNLLEENDFLPNLQEIRSQTIKKTKVLWINYPNNPTASIAPKSFLKEVVDFGHNKVRCKLHWKR